jgi:hypothetical protein
MCVNLSIVPSIDGSFSNEDKIKAYQKILFQDDPPLGGKNFKGKKFIHVWGANSENFNNNAGDKIDGGGQATAFREFDESGNKLGQQFGIFGITTTIHKYNQSELHIPDKIHGAPSPSPALAPSRTSSSASPSDLSRAASSAST